MSQVGKPKERIIIKPDREPVPVKNPEPTPTPVEEPVEQPA
jgi:hypothetical protein